MPDDIEAEEIRARGQGPRRAPSRSAGGRKRGARSVDRRSTQARPPVSGKGLGGVAPIIAGVAVIAPILMSELARRDPLPIIPVSMLILIFGLAGLRKAQEGRDGALGRLGFLVSSAGALLLAVVLPLSTYNQMVLNTRLRNAVSLISIGFVILLVGVVIFGVAMVKAGRLNRVAALVLLLSIPAGMALDRFAMFTEPGLRLLPGFRAGVKIFGLALIWLGYTILSKPTRTSPAETAPS